MSITPQDASIAAEKLCRTAPVIPVLTVEDVSHAAPLAKALVAGGLPALKALAAPFGQCRFCPTGGIGLDNASEWLAFDPVLCVGGSWVAPRGPVDVDKVASVAREAAGLTG